MALKPQPKLEHQRVANVRGWFLDEFNAQCSRNGLTTQKLIGGEIGVSPNTVGNYRKSPGNIPMEVMQNIVKKLKPDIGVVLQFLGYSNAEITRFAKEVLL